MNILTLDFETYFDEEYTLKKLTTEHYVRDARFEALGVGIRWNEYPEARCQETIWYSDEMIQPGPQCIFNQIDWANTAALAHHAHFDGLILSHHYGVKPKMWLDTLSMARLMLGNHLSVGLESLARHYGLASKTVPYDRMCGVHWADMDHSLRQELATGCIHDIALTWDIFQRLAVGFPQEEYAVIDFTVRAFTEPQLMGDIDELGRVWQDERERKRMLLSELGVDETALQSADKFAELLRAKGVEPETKAGKNGAIPALAATDDFMKDLLAHEDDDVRLLAESRIAVKSNGAQTRAERLGWMAVRGKQ